MLVEGAFLQAILADPDDDAPRLIYADWLDEQGESQRAEFIRVQCALARAPRHDPAWGELWDRQRDLIVANGNGWSAALRQFVTNYWCRRGFADEVWLSGQALLAHAATIFAMAPLRTAHVREIGPEGVRSLTALSSLGSLSTLDLSGNGGEWRYERGRGRQLVRPGIGNEGAEHLAGWRGLGQLRLLDLRGCAVSEAAAGRIRSSRHARADDGLRVLV
jgi:uncharacterized protein (TIGR02996 family)